MMNADDIANRIMDLMDRGDLPEPGTVAMEDYVRAFAVMGATHAQSNGMGMKEFLMLCANAYLLSVAVEVEHEPPPTGGLH